MGSVLTAQLGRTRPSASDRERVAVALRRACVDERLSTETFGDRIDAVYAARTRAELDGVLSDVREPGIVHRLVLDAVAWASRFSLDVSHAWRAPRTPRMILPLRERVVIGRSPALDFVIADRTVSSRHAVLDYDGERWTLSDAGSLNGTYVNGRRLAGPTVVRPGDELTVGETRFVLASPTV
jgi:hypothetical protein